jgi:NhaP-type Na+/H+ or K+/H+ antiporter
VILLSLIDHESFLSFGVALTFFTLGCVGILGSDDILCCFIVGNSFTWDDWFRVQTEDHAFQDVIDQLLSTVRIALLVSELLWHVADRHRVSSCTSERLCLGIILPTGMASRSGVWSSSGFWS